MEIKTASNRMYAIIALYDMHTPYFHNALEGISDEDATDRLATKANHMAWITGSLVQERFEMANLLGLDLKSTANELFKNHQGIQDDAIYPALATYKKDWDHISPLLRAALLKVTDEELNKVIDFPGMNFPLYDMVTFNSYREANCIGQIALWRRLLGYDGMKYM